MRQDVHRCVLGAELVQHPDRAGREATARHVGGALHEQHHALPLDRLLDVVADIRPNFFLSHLTPRYRGNPSFPLRNDGFK
jgi:hypothetical protein